MMLPKSIQNLCVSLIFTLTLVACGGGGSSKPPEVNSSPVVSAGDDQVVNEQTSVTLAGSATDDDGNIVSYQWLQISGTDVTLSSLNEAESSFTAPILTQEETLTFSLTVQDNKGASASDQIDIIIKPVNDQPIAHAGDDQVIFELNDVILVGTGEDTDGNIVDYFWRQTAGTTVTLSNENDASPTFSAPEVNKDEVLTFELTVTDNENGIHRDSVDIQVLLNTLPIANAGDSQFVSGEELVSLDASASVDAESELLDFSWVQTDNSGVSITLDDSYSEQPSFTAPVLNTATTITFELTVEDEGGLESIDIINISIAPLITLKINDTGIQRCGDYAYGNSLNHNNDLFCTDSVDYHNDPIPPGQDGHYGRDIVAGDYTYDIDGKGGFSYTKLDAQGDPLPVDATEWSCVLDNVTQLIWEVKTNDGRLHHYNNSYGWYNPDNDSNGGYAGEPREINSCSESRCDSEGFISETNAQGLCGEFDWRLPSKEELLSIVDYSATTSDLDIDRNFFPNMSSGWHLTSDTYAPNNQQVWHLSFSARGWLNQYYSKQGAGYIMLVRSKQ